MFRSPLLLEEAKREGGEEQLERVRNGFEFMRVFLEDLLLYNWGCPLKTWYNKYAAKRKHKRSVPDQTLNIYPFSNQSKAMSDLHFPLLDMLPWKSVYWNKPYWKNSRTEVSRFSFAKKLFQEGNTVIIRFYMPLYVLLHEIVNPITKLVLYFVSVTMRIIILMGVRFPLLWLYYSVFRSGIFGKELLTPGENGYTRIFRGGEDINLEDLERELMTRNSDNRSSVSLQDANIIAISYKHYANKGKVPDDDRRICRTDLQALAFFIKAAAPCDVKFWIDAKLPPTSDNSFERWINRGVRPYGRYITFICPSAMKHAESSFWLANECEFALAGKGVMFLHGDEIYYGRKGSFRNSISLHRRLLHIIIGDEHSPVQVRDEDKDKVINWAMCCLRGTEQDVAGAFTPCIDYLKREKGLFISPDGQSDNLLLLNNIKNVIRAYGPQELPVIPGRSWNEQNPCLLGDSAHQDFDFSRWLGLSNDESPTRIYFIHFLSSVNDMKDATVVGLEVRLDKPHFSPGKIQITRKVFREIESSTLLDCKFVTVPWLCEWE